MTRSNDASVAMSGYQLLVSKYHSSLKGSCWLQTVAGNIQAEFGASCDFRNKDVLKSKY